MTIVLMHGFGAFMHLLAGMSIRPMTQALAAGDRRVYAPMVQPYSPVPDRASFWMKHLTEIRSQSPEPMHLIAFSSGGLDARYVISRLGGHSFVASLTTISTPHHGSSLAEYILERPDSVHRGVVRLADWMGDRLQDHDVSNAERALEELTTGYVTDVFNPAAPDHPDVTYRSWAGKAGVGTDIPIMPGLWFPNRIVFDREGLNDGIVSVASATWTNFRGTIDADHARQIGIKSFNGTFDSTDFISSIVAELEQFSQPDHPA